MGERKGVNKYYPPDYDPTKGGLNKFHGTHALRERASKLHEGILIIRFEMPYNIWCGGCGKHIGMGVRFNAQKRKMGNYYTTPIYKFNMKCPLCPQHFEIQTDPKNCEYQILSGCRRKEERWDTEKAGNVQTLDRDVKQKLMSDAMFKLEHESKDQIKLKKVAPTLSKLEEIRDGWKDDFAVNQLLRRKFREEKKDIKEEKLKDDIFKEKANLPKDLQLAKESIDDAIQAKKMRYGKADANPEILRRLRNRQLKESSIFTRNAKQELATTLLSRVKTNNKNNEKPLKGFSKVALETLVKSSVKRKKKKIPSIELSNINTDISTNATNISANNGNITANGTNIGTSDTVSNQLPKNQEIEKINKTPMYKTDNAACYMADNSSPTTQTPHNIINAQSSNNNSTNASKASKMDINLSVTKVNPKANNLLVGYTSTTSESDSDT